MLNKRESLAEKAPFLTTAQIAEASKLIDEYTGEL
jgi:hypothetical protein